jgi:hypothetical protein
MDHQAVQFALNTAVSIVGSGVGTTVVGLLFKRKFDRDLENHRALLSRAANLHGRMVDTLAALYRHFVEAQACFQGMTASARFTGEISREEYERRVADSMESARDKFLQGRLFIPRTLAEQCDGFLKVVLGGRLDFSLAQDPMFDAVQKAEYWQAAAKTANQELPKLLQEIEDAARALIHSGG